MGGADIFVDRLDATNKEDALDVFLAEELCKAYETECSEKEIE